MWSVDSLPFNPVTQVIPGFLVCDLSIVVSGVGTEIVLTKISGRPALVYMSSVVVQSLCSTYRYLPKGIWVVSP